MVRSFEEPAFALQPGEVTGIVKTGFGFHIIKLLERRTKEDRLLQQIYVSTQYPTARDRRLRPKLEAKERSLLEGVLADLQKPGASFEDLAMKHCEDVSSRTQGGYLTPYREGIFKGEFDDAVRAMKKGDPPRIVKDQHGNLHLIVVEGVERTEFDAVRETLRGQILGRPVGAQERLDYIKALRRSATVQG
jgi:peptidyl-prolyl cis-trans isomerase SurA